MKSFLIGASLIDSTPKANPISQFGPLKFINRFMSKETALKGALSAIDQGIISLVNFAASVLIGHYVEPTQFGIYTVGFLAILLVRAVQEGIIITPLNAFGAGLELNEFRKYVTATGFIQLILAAASAVAALLLGAIITDLGNDMAGPTIFALWFAFLTWQLQEFIRRVFYTRGQVFFAVLSTIISSIIRIAAILIMANRHTLNGIQGLNANGWGALAAFAVGGFLARKYWDRNWQNIYQTWKQNWKFGRWTLGGTIANWVTVQMYPIITAGMISFAAAGAYQALQNLVAPVHVLLRASDTFLTPRTAKLYQKSGTKGVRRVLKLTYIFTGIPIIGVLMMAVFFARPLLHLMRGDTYLSFSNGAYIMAVFYIFWYTYWPLQTAFKAIRVSLPIFIANIAATISMFTIGLLMINTWGVYGTMAGQGLNALIISIVLWISWSKLNGKKPAEPQDTDNYPISEI